MMIGLWPKKLYLWKVLFKETSMATSNTSPARMCQNTVHRRGLRLGQFGAVPQTYVTICPAASPHRSHGRPGQFARRPLQPGRYEEGAFRTILVVQRVRVFP